MKKEKLLMKRAASLMLAAAMTISSTPFLEVLAASDIDAQNENDAFTFVVTDEEGNKIQDAKVTITNTENDFKYIHTTDEDGEASFPEFTEMKESVSDEFTCDYVISKEDYVELSGSISSKVQGWTGRLSLSLLQLESIDFDALGFNAYTGTYDGNEHDAISHGVIDGYDVKYSLSENGEFSETVPKVKDAGTTNVFVKISKDKYKTAVRKFTSEISQAERDFEFDESNPVDLYYESDLTYTNAAAAEQEAESEITYSSNNTDIATVDEDGTVHFKKIGTVKIYAEIESGLNYKGKKISYQITVQKGPRTGFAFDISNPSEQTYDPENTTFNNAASFADGDGDISYEITEQSRDDAEVNDVAVIDENTGELTIKNAGTVKVKATISEGENYQQGETYYTLVINRAEQKELAFSKSDYISMSYGEEINNPVIHKMSEGNVTYSVDSENQYVSVNKHGKIKGIGIGSTKVTAHVEGDSKYESKDIICNITVNKAEQDFKLEQTAPQITYGTDQYEILSSGGLSDSEITYEVILNESNIIKEINENVISFNTQTGSATVKVTKKGNEFYNDKVINCVITIDMSYTNSSYKVECQKYNAETGWYRDDVIVSPNDDSGFDQIGLTKDGPWDESIVFDEEKEYEDIQFYLMKKEDKSSISCDNNLLKGLKIDKTAPSAPTISYSLDATDNKIYSNGSVTVTVTSTDSLSGVDKFECVVGDNTLEIKSNEIEVLDGIPTAYFNIEPEYVGKIKVVAYDKAGNNSPMDGETELILDNTPPDIDFSVEGEQIKNVYKDNANVNIIISDPHIDISTAKVTVSKREINSSEYTDAETAAVEFSDESAEKYVGSLLLSGAGDYRVTVECFDKCGNNVPQNNDVEIMSSNPQTSIIFKDNSTEEYFSTDREATVQIKTDHLCASIINVKCSAVDVSGNEIGSLSEDKQQEFNNYLQNPANWSIEDGGKLYVTKDTLKFTENANYTLTVEYGNDPVSTAQFCIDKEKTRGLDIKYSQSIGDYILENITFGFYKSKAEVTIIASDDISGISRLSYCYQEGAEYIDVSADKLKFSNNGRTAEYTFTITPEYKGKVCIKAYDNSGNYDEFDGTKQIVVDDIAPVIDLSIKDNNEADIYVGTATACLKINEDNFYASDVDVELSKKEINQSEYSDAKRLSLDFETNGSEHTAEYIINEEGRYKITVSYTDKSGNEAESKEYEFIVLCSPDEHYASVEFDNNNVQNGSYYKDTRKAVVKIEADSLVPELLSTVVTADDVSGSEIEYETGKVAEIKQNEFNDIITKEENWEICYDENSQKYYQLKKKLVFNTSANYSFRINYYGSQVSDDYSFCVDHIAPKNLKVSYMGSEILNSIINGTKYHFYDQQIPVSVTADDTISGIDYIVYSCISEEGTLNTFPVYNKRVDLKTEENTEGFILSDDGKTATFNFMVAPQFRGKVEFTAYDKAGNKCSSNNSAESIVSDDIAPLISVEYDNNNTYYDSYYKSDRTATITIEEENFYPENVEIVVEGREDEYSDFEKIETDISFEEKIVGGSKKYQATVDFNENMEYKFSVSMTDKSGNAGETFTDHFTVDKKVPVLEVEYDNDQVKNNSYYKSDRTAYITVTDTNLQLAEDGTLEDAVIKVNKRKDSLGNWETATLSPKFEKNGNIYTAQISFAVDEDSSMDFDNFYISVTDKAGNSSEYKDSFTVDKSVPVIQVEYDNNDVENDTYYKADRTAYVTITDSNLELNSDGTLKDAVITVRERKDSLDSWRTRTLDPIFTKNGNVYSTVIDFKVSDNSCKDFDEFTVIITDKADNSSSFSDSFTIDKAKPVIEVSYDNNTAYNGTYYNSDRIATVTITESNFMAEDADIIVGKQGNSDTKYSDIKIINDFTTNGNKHIIKVYFDDDADYKFNVSYTDNAGNNASIAEQSFTVDKTKPVIKVTYDNNSAKNSKYFNKSRKATITVTEHNFNNSNFDGVDFKVKATDASGKTVSLPDYSSQLKKSSAWKKNGDAYTATVQFDADANYTFDFAYTDMAENTSGEVNYGNSKAPKEFTVDKAVPSGSVKIGNWEAWSQYTDNFTFGRWSNSTINVQITSEDSLSGIDVVEYLKTPDVLTETQAKNSQGWVKVNKGQDSFKVSPNEKLIVYVHFVDMAGNEKYISSNGIILDDKDPVVENIAPQIKITPGKSAFSGVYNSDVDVDVKVVDPAAAGNVYSGLRKITYEVINMGTVTQAGTLFEYTDSNPKFGNLVQTYEQASCIKVNSSANNSNDVVIKVTAVDNAGNSAVQTHSIKIDTTAPVISLSYNNNSAQNNSYFNKDRTATIKVTERNFSPDDVNVKITNTDGIIPKISSWTSSSGSGNGDDTVWTAKIDFTSDGDYTFDISCSDMAGNSNSQLNIASDTVAAKSFTIDKTKPVLKVEYSNNDANHNNYYKATREATISINEHNFSKSNVTISVEASLDGKKITSPSVGSWVDNGDVHTAKISYENDGYYEFKIRFTDDAGNEIDAYPDDKFYIDLKKPVVEISGVEQNKAYKNQVKPQIKFSDINFDPESVIITLTGAENGEVFSLKGSELITSSKFKGEFTETDNGTVFTFNNFEEVQGNDDIYTLRATTVDMSGNSESGEVVFSVNRFGSAYEFGSAADKLNNKFIKDPEDVVITEINATELSGVKITLFKNNETIVLEEGKDYSINKEGGNGEWYKYTYTIFKKNFEDDGVYRISLHSEDAAGNVSENTLDSKNKEISFAVDKTAPDVIVTNLESGKTYPVSKLTVRMAISDNIQLSDVVVYLDGKEYKSWNIKDIEKLISDNEDFLIDIDGSSNSSHTLRIVCTDSAGNKTETEIKGFYVTTNFWIRFYNNKIAFFGSIGGLLLVIAFVIFLIVFKKKRK